MGALELDGEMVMDKAGQHLNRILVFAETHGSMSDKMSAIEVRAAYRLNTEETNKKLRTLRDSINGDCYMGEDWELATIDWVIGEMG